MWNLRCPGIFVLLSIFLSGPATQAESTLNFPCLSFDPAIFTGVAIVNPSHQDAVVTLTAYGENGQPLLGTGITNPAEIMVPANQQRARLTSEFFGVGPDAATVAWFQATSPTNGLTGFFLFVDDNISKFDGADLPVLAKTIVFNQVRVGAGGSTELNIINPGDSSTVLEVELVDGASSPRVQSLSLAPKGVVRLDVGTFFGVSQSSPASYVRVSSTTEIAGFELVSTPGGDALGLNALDVAGARSTLYFPQKVVMGPWKTELGLVNYSDQVVITTISAYQPDGTLYDTADLQVNPVTRSLGAGESLLESLETLFGFAGANPLEGWLQVKSTSSALNGFLNYGIPDAGSVASVVSSSAGQKRAIFSHLTTSEGFFTGLALLNSGQLAANIRILVMTPSGDVLGSFTSVLRPGQRLSRLIDQLIPETTDRNGGFIWVKSDLPLHFTSIFGSSSVLANIPPQAAPESYRPDTGLTSVEVTPSLAVAQPNQTTQFEIAGVGETVTWSVNDQIGGSTEAGTISQAGLYQAPATIPDPRVITVTDESAGQTGGASVDILSKESLFSSTNVVQSVAYLGSLEKLYTAELAILSAAEPGTRPALASPAQESANSEIFEFGPGGIKIRLARFKSEAIVKLIPFRAANGKEFLLLASRTNGRIYRLDPENGSNQLVVSNLNEPTALVIDFLTGDLLVAQKDQIIIIPRLELEAGLTAALRIFPPGDRPLTADLFPTDAADGITTDRCTGDVYISKRENGEILRYDRSTGQLETFVSGLRQPTQLLSLYRKGVPCPDSFQFIVIEQENDRTLLFRGVSGARSNWIEVKDGTDIAFLPPGSSFSRGEAILLAEAQGNGPAQQGGGVVNVVEADGIYEPEPDNEPDPQQQADPLEITSESPLADGEDNMAYSTTLSAQGGTRPFSWSLVSGNLPRGLSLDSDSGRISGTPSRSGTSSFTVKVTDSLSDTSSKTFTLKIDEDPDPLRITTGSSLPGGTSADSYSTTLKAAGGKPSYHWSVQSGSLPDGLSLSSSGVLSGTPVGTGTFNFRGRVTDRDGDSETKSFSLNISLGGQ